MNLRDFFRKYRRYFLFYGLIWLFGAFFIGQNHIERGLGGALQWILMVMIVDAPATFLLAIYIFPRFLKPEKIIHLVLSVAVVNILTVMVYSILQEWIGLAKFGFPFWEVPLWESLYLLQSYGFREAIHTVFMASLLMGLQYFDVQRRLLRLEKEKAQAELRLLRAQVNPHFLFNNLNVLSSLIQKDARVADEFITRFSKLYRYLLKSKDKDFVKLSEELEFLEDYLYLLHKRFGNAYDVRQHITPEAARNYAILPASLQGLIENAVKHNQGDQVAPLPIDLLIEGDQLVVRNAVRPKFMPAESTGTGLANLNARYELLTQTPIEVKRENGRFEVKVPLIEC